MLSDLIGNPHIKKYLTRMLEKKAIANSLLFGGPDGVGKGLFALGFAEALLGSPTHPDLHIYRPAGKIGMHPIETLRKFSEEVYMAPFQGKWKVFIIHDAERMLPTSANALLKTFEEPPQDTVIILLSSQPSALLPTILSRCRTLHFHAIPETEIAEYLEKKLKVGSDEAKRLSFLSQGSLGDALKLMSEGKSQVRQKLLALLSKGPFNDYKQLTEAVQGIAEEIETAKKQIEESMQEELMSKMQDTMTAAQKESLQKQVDGAVAMHQKHAAQELFDILLGWYRDLQLMLVKGNRKLLMHSDFESEMEQALHRGEILSIDQVQKAIAEARLSLDRSTSLALTLETLFLKLNFC